MFLGLGVSELVVILLVALIIFGPKNLPKLGTAVGKTIKNVREGMEEDDSASDTEGTVASTSQAVADDSDKGDSIS